MSQRAVAIADTYNTYLSKVIHCGSLSARGPPDRLMVCGSHGISTCLSSYGITVTRKTHLKKQCIAWNHLRYEGSTVTDAEANDKLDVAHLVTSVSTRMANLQPDSLRLFKEFIYLGTAYTI